MPVYRNNNHVEMKRDGYNFNRAPEHSRRIGTRIGKNLGTGSAIDSYPAIPISIHPHSHCLASYSVIIMLGLSRKSAFTSSRCIASGLRATSAKQTAQLVSRDFHSTQLNAAFQPTWMPMRVKTPWVDALAKQREEARSGQKEGAPSAKPDLTPKKMSDSYYSAVGIQNVCNDVIANLCRSCR